MDLRFGRGLGEGGGEGGIGEGGSKRERTGAGGRKTLRVILRIIEEGAWGDTVSRAVAPSWRKVQR